MGEEWEVMMGEWWGERNRSCLGIKIAHGQMGLPGQILHNQKQSESGGIRLSHLPWEESSSPTSPTLILPHPMLLLPHLMLVVCPQGDWARPGEGGRCMSSP